MSGSNVKDKEPKSTMLCSSEEQQWLQSIKYTFLRTSGCDDARNVKTFIFCKRQLCFSKSPNRATSIVGGQNWSFSSGHVKKKREREREIPIKGVSPCPMWWPSTKSTPVDLYLAAPPREQPQRNILILTGWAPLIPWESGSSIMGDISHGEDLDFSSRSLWSQKTRHLN